MVLEVGEVGLVTVKNYHQGSDGPASPPEITTGSGAWSAAARKQGGTRGCRRRSARGPPWFEETTSLLPAATLPYPVASRSFHQTTARYMATPIAPPMNPETNLAESRPSPARDTRTKAAGRASGCGMPPPVPPVQSRRRGAIDPTCPSRALGGRPTGMKRPGRMSRREP